MRVRLWLAGVAAMALVCVGATNASADTVTFQVPINGAIVNDCTGETVAIQGTQHFKVTDNSSLDGSKSQLETNLTGVKGTTLTGVRYVMNDQISEMAHADFDPSEDAQMTTENTTILTRQGETGAVVGGDDFRLHLLTHLTVTNGVPRAEKFDLRADCR